jgi:hypothetical protein
MRVIVRMAFSFPSLTSASSALSNVLLLMAVIQETALWERTGVTSELGTARKQADFQEDTSADIVQLMLESTHSVDAGVSSASSVGRVLATLAKAAAYDSDTSFASDIENCTVMMLGILVVGLLASAGNASVRHVASSSDSIGAAAGTVHRREARSVAFAFAFVLLAGRAFDGALTFWVLAQAVQPIYCIRTSWPL